MNVIPAIDLRQGRCVRLLRGEKGSESVYGEDPVEIARHWVSEGASSLHVVDLDAAFGEPSQRTLIGAIVRSVDVSVQIGGGVRSSKDFHELLDAGVARVVFGTVALERPEVVEGALADAPDAVVVGIDVKDGRVAVRGWTETAGGALLPAELGRRWASSGVSRFVYTETSRDGAMEGVDVAATGAFARAVGRPVIASGGVGTLEDLRALKPLTEAGVDGVIVGKALYENVFTLAAAQAVLEG